ncbi:MAG: S-layer family protein [Mesorhizobium sp.]|nr:MAG: S-layer family protein [Mesorhizobium sp.]
MAGLTGAGVVNFTGTTDLDVSYRGFDIGGPVVGTINIANVAGSTLTIDGGEGGIVTNGLQGGIINVGGNGGLASIGATTSTSGSAISLSGGNDLINATLNYKGSIKVDAGSVLGAGSDWTHLDLSGSVTSTTSSMAFGFFGANGVYDISSTIAHTGGIGVAFNGTSQGTATFSGTSKTFSTGATDAIVRSAGIGTLAFTNGGLGITTGFGYGINASTTGAGRFSVSGPNNTITTTTGSALRLDGATLGADGVNFSSISVNGAGTGILLNNVSGGAVNLGTVNLQGITGANARGVDISGTLGTTVGFTSLNIGIAASATNAVGLDLNGAALGTSNITAGDFDVDGGGSAGSIGIDMAGTTGTGTIQLGDTVNNNPAGQISTISNVGYGVQFSSATNAKLVFGDGQGPAESTISTTGGQVIHATDTLPASGDYNFDDVNFSGDISNLSAISVYYIDAAGNLSGTGNGSFLNPGSVAQAELSSANVFVLIDKTTGGTETIDIGGGSFDLKDGQALISFQSGDATIDVSQLGVGVGAGAPISFHFTTIPASTTVSNPGGLDNSRPILASNGAAATISLPTSGSGVITAGVQNVTAINSGSGAGISTSASVMLASNFVLRNNTITAGGNALDFSTTGAPANTLLLSIDGNTLRSTASGLAASFTGQNISATDNSIAIRSFAGNKMTGGAGSGGVVFNNVRFDSDGAGGTVNAGTLAVGNPGARIQGNGLSFINTSGTFNMGTLNLANTGGTGVIANTKTTNFTLSNIGGTVDTTNGTAFNLDPLNVNLKFATVTASGGASGIIFDGVAGTFTVTGLTSITGTTGFGIDAINTNPGTFNFNTLTIDNNNTAGLGGGIGWASGTLNVTGLADIDTTTGDGLSQGGGTTSFANGLTIDTTSGTGIVGTGGTMGITATAAAQTVNSTGGQAINLSGVAAAIALDSTTSGGGANNVSLTSVAGTINLGTGTLTNNFAGAAFSVGSGADLSGGNATISYAGAIVSNGSGAAVSILELTGGSVTLSGNLTDTNAAGGGQIVVANINNGTAATVTFSGATKQIQSGAADGVNLVGNANGTIDFSNGGLAISTTSGTGFAAQAGGTISVAGTTNTITSAGNALRLDAVTVGSGINFNSVSTSSGAVTGIGLANVASSGGAINLGTVNLQGISSRGVDVTGTLGAGLNFNSLSIGLTSTTAVAFDLNGAQINAAITANDFDVINSIGAGTSIGVDLRGATGGQIVRLGDAVAGGASSSISGVNTGVFLDSATNLAFTYGDGESATDQASTIGASVGIDASSAPAAGTYNFQDVNFAASPGLGFGVGKIYFVGASATGDGTGRDQNNLATLTTAEAASVTSDVLVLVNDGGTITAAGSGADNTLVLSTGEQVRGFGNGNINLAMSVPSTIQLASNSISIVDATPNGAATLTTNAGSNAITLGASGNFIDGFILDGSPAGAARGIKDNGGGASGTIISHMTIQNFATAGVEITPSTSTGIDNTTFAGNASDVIVNALNTIISDVSSTGATGIAFDLRNTTGTTTLSNLNVTTAATGTGIVLGGASGPQGTITGSNVDVTGGAGGGIKVLGGNAAIGFDAASFVGVASGSVGTAVTITGRSGGSFAFAGAVVANGAASGISVSGATAANTVGFTGPVALGTVSTLTGTAVSIDNNGTSSTVSFFNLGIVTSGTTGFSAANGGTVNVSTGTVNSSGAQAINLNGVATTTGINFTSTTSTGGANNVSLTNVTGAGTVSLGTGSLTGATGVAFLLNGGAATVSYGGTLTKTTAGKIVDISGVTGGTVTLSGNLSATGGGDNGIFVHGNTGGAFTFSGGTKTLTTDANTAVDLTNNGGATIDFTGGGLAINTTTGTGFSATGAGTLSVTGGGNSITTTSGVAINLQGITVGGSQVTFASTTKGAGGTSAVVMNGVVGAGSVNLGTGSLVGGSAATILIGDGAGGANTGGTAGLIYAGGITSGASQAVNIQDRTAGAQNINLSGNISHISASQTGIILADNAAGTITFSGGTKLISSGSATAVAIANTGASAVFSFGGLSISTTAGNGLDISGTGTVTISGGLNTVNTQTGTAFANLGGSATVTSDAALTTGNAGRVVDIQNRTANNVTLSGNVSNTGPGALGLRVQNVTGGTVTFSGAKMLTTTTNTAVNLNSNTNGTINFTGGGLAINTTTGIGFNATGGGTVTVQGIVNTITSTTGTALNVSNTTIGASGLTFQSISANGAVNGIVLNNTGAGGLTVTGVGTNAGSGGTIQNTTGRGASFISASNITLKNMNFTNAGTDDLDADNSGLSTGDNLATNAAIHLQNVSTATLDRIAISGSAEQGINGNTVSNFTLSNSSISNAGNSADEDGIHFYNMSGTSAITNTTITGSGDDNFNLQTQSGTLALTISGGSSTGAVLGSGYLFGIRGTSNATINLSSANSSNNFSGGIVADAFDNSTMNLNVINSTSSSNNDQLSVSAGDNSDVSLVATGNTLSSTATGDFVVVSLLGSAFDNGFTFDARIENNNITVANGLTADGISVFNAGGGAMRVGIKNNTIDYAGTQRAILVQTGQDGAGSILAQITGNAIDIKLDGTGNAVAGILVQSGITSPTGDGSSIDLNIGGAGALANTFTHSLGGTMAGGDIRVRQRNNGTINLSGYAGGATDLAAAIAYLNGRNTVVSASTATADSTGFTGLATPPFP